MNVVIPAVPADGTLGTLLDPAAAAYFAQQRGTFGCMNLLPAHLPAPEREHQLVQNVMTVQYGIARAFASEEYLRPLRLFAVERPQFGAHFAALEAQAGPALAQTVAAAAGDTMDTVNLFSPKQCNLACNGCYTAAKPLTRYPYGAEFVASYYETARAVIAGAKRMGARTVYTSGDGELTTYPRFFDLLEFVAEQGMQWLFFTAGLAFSSEIAAVAAWDDIQKYASRSTVDRIAARLAAPGASVAGALLAELGRYRDHIQVYHSLWSIDPASNDRYRNPQIGAYAYETVATAGGSVAFPSSLPRMLETIFAGERRERFGIEMPVGAFNVTEVCRVAEYVAEQGLKSYFEPVIETGRNTHQVLAGMDALPAEVQLQIAPLLVRESCSFRNIYQPTVKARWTSDGPAQLYVSPGMGIDLEDLGEAGVLEPLAVTAEPNSMFRAVNAPLLSYAGFAYPTGCKCNDFAQRLVKDAAPVHAEWQRASRAVDVASIELDAVVARLSNHAANGV